MASLSPYLAVSMENITGQCYAECPNFTEKIEHCPSLQAEISWYDAIAGLRLVSSLLSIIGSLSIITSVLYHRRIKSCEVIPIFVLAWADMLLSVFFVIGSAYWYHPTKDEDDSSIIYLCIVTSVFTAVLALISSNLTVVYALTLCLRMKMRTLKENRTKLLVKRTFFALLVVAYIASWCTPVAILIPEYVTNDPFWRCANSCTCGCQLSYLNILPQMEWKYLANSSYLSAARTLYEELAITLTINYIIDLILLVILYGILLQRMFCSRKGRLQEIGEELLLSDAQDRLRERSCKAVCRIMSYLTIFVLCGIVNFIVSGLILYHLRNSQSDPPTTRKIALYMIQGGREECLSCTLTQLGEAVTLPLQGFCNALVYGWSRQMFRSKVLAERTPLIAPTSGRQGRETTQVQVSFEAPNRGNQPAAVAENVNRRYTND